MNELLLCERKGGTGDRRRGTGDRETGRWMGLRRRERTWRSVVMPSYSPVDGLVVPSLSTRMAGVAGVAAGVAVAVEAVEETPVSMLDDGLMSSRLEMEREGLVEVRDKPEMFVVARYGCRSGESAVREGG